MFFVLRLIAYCDIIKLIPKEVPMRLRATKSAHSVSYSVIKSAYINKKRTTVTVEKLGNEKEICKKYGVSDALAWAKE